ncbi:MAG: hypothetical protein ABIG44_13785 [Planctomycetota bacterium]
MNAGNIRKYLLFIVIVAQPAWGQAVLQSDPTGITPQVAEISPDRLAAGVRAYPASVLRAVLTLADDPLVLRQLNEQPTLFENPQSAEPPIAPELHQAIRELRYLPEIVALAAAYPEELGALRQLYNQAPSEMEARITELKAGYHFANMEAANDWQALLQTNAVARDAYLKLLTQFCRAQLAEYPDFPCVIVNQADYVYACTPNDLIMAYAEGQQPDNLLWEIMLNWWTAYAPETMDERVLSGQQTSLDLPPATDFVYGWEPGQRTRMWSIPTTGELGDVALVPVIMQPATDQPPEARLAYAVSEHARLWAPQLAGQTSNETSVVVAPEQYREPMEADEPVVTKYIEPQYDTLTYGDTPAHERDVVVVYEDRDDDWYRYVNSPTYHIYYSSGSCYPYYSSYPWTWPLFCDGYSLHDDYVFGVYYGYGARPRIDYYDSLLRFSFRLGGGSYVYYNCPTHRRSHSYHHQRVVRHGEYRRNVSHSRRYYRRATPLTRGRTHRIGSYTSGGRSTRLVDSLRRGSRSHDGRRTGLERYGYSRNRAPVAGPVVSNSQRARRQAAVSQPMRRSSGSTYGPRVSRTENSQRPNAQTPRGSRTPAVRRPTSRSDGMSDTQRRTVQPSPRSSDTQRRAVQPSPRSSDTQRRTVQPSPRSSDTQRRMVQPSPRSSSTPRQTVRPSPRSSDTQRRAVQPSPRSSDAQRRTVQPSPRSSNAPRKTVRPSPRSSNTPRKSVRPSPRSSSSGKRSSVSPSRRSSSRSQQRPEPIKPKRRP